MSDSLIIADLHLVTNEVEKTRLFTEFCQTRAIKADRLFILGDLFNTWLGDDLSIDYYQGVIATLKKLSTDTQIFIITGNRDFLLGNTFEQQSGCQLLQTPYLLKTRQQDYVLIHGDELCTDDINYQRLKRVLQHPIIQSIFLKLPKKLRLRLAGKLRQKSVAAQQKKSAAIMDVNQTTVDNFMHQYLNANLIHGHTHRQNTHVGEHYTRHVLGDWSAHQGNAIQIDGKGILIVKDF